MSGRKDVSLDAKHKAVLKKMMQLPENKTCADCGGPSPRWASTNLGVFLCISCSGFHRQMGSHVSKVRSITLDVWTADQIAHFTQLGNAKAAQIYEARLPHGFRRPSSRESQAMELFIRNKYERRLYTADGPGAGTGTGATSGSFSSQPVQVQSNASPILRGRTLGPRPNIYDMLPRKNAPYDSHGSNRNAHSYSSQFLGSGQSPSMGSARASQMNPVATSLIEMGFPEQLAVEAAGRHRDLQSAADWVLRQKSVRLYSAPAVRLPTMSPENDLLNGSSMLNPAPTPTKLTPKAVPKAFGTESLLGDTIPKHDATASLKKSTKGDDDDDFTDFGAFESALPTATPVPAVQPSVKGGSSLSASLAGLYAQGPPKSPIGSTRLPLPSVASPLTTGKTGMRTKATSPIFTKLANAPGTPPPPPPPPSNELSTVTPPPPPSPRAPVGAQPVRRHEPEEEDPFAFLSKEALTFASSKKKKSVQTQANKSNNLPNKSSSAIASNTTGDFSFEDLLK